MAFRASKWTEDRCFVQPEDIMFYCQWTVAPVHTMQNECIISARVSSKVDTCIISVQSRYNQENLKLRGKHGD